MLNTDLRYAGVHAICPTNVAVLFQYSGNFNNGGFNNQGTTGNGNYWSSSVNNATNAHNLWFNASNVNPANTNNKGNGHAVRCVAPARFARKR